MKQILKEWRQYSEYHELFERHDYIEHVLGIKPLLNESNLSYCGSEIRELIIKEHLLLEGFFDDIKQIGNVTDNMFLLAKSLRVILSDPKKILSWRKSLKRFIITPRLKEIYTLINTMIEKLPQLNMPTLAKWAEGIKSLLDNFTDKINKSEGWKGAMFMTGAALAVNYVWNNIGEYVTAANQGVKQFIQKFISDKTGGQKEEIIEKLKKFLNQKVVIPMKKFLVEKIKDAAGAIAFDSIKGWIGWAKRAFDGAKFISDTLARTLDRFRRYSMSTKPGDKLSLQENTNE